MSEEILVTLHRQEQFNIIVRPHPLLLRPSRTGGRDFGRILSQLTNERFKVADAADVPIQEYMAASDILVSDVSSVVFEFLFLDRPILVQTNASVIRYYDGEAYLKDILPAVTVFEEAGQLPEKLQMAFEQPNALSIERKLLLAREYYNVGRATDAAVNSVYRHLHLTPLRRADSFPPHGPAE
jgi:CDP-glycerol glycerophosphotransferase (TagB/SpsB family)